MGKHLFNIRMSRCMQIKNHSTICNQEYSEKHGVTVFLHEERVPARTGCSWTCNLCTMATEKPNDRTRLPRDLKFPS